MKKILSTIFIVICCCLPMTSFAYTACAMNNSICQCFIDNCHLNPLAIRCDYRTIKAGITTFGAHTLCRRYQPNDVATCVLVSDFYISSSSPCS